MAQERDLEQFKSFARNTAKHMRIPQGINSYKNSFGKTYNTIRSHAYTQEEIRDILNSGNTEAIRELSRYFTRYSGIYARMNQYYSSLLNYTYLLIPHYDVSNPPKKLQTSYKWFSQYVKDLNLDYILPKINEKIIGEGVFFGILKEPDSDKRKAAFYQLPAKYCRTRFNDENGLAILELNLNYFDNISYNEIEKKEILKLFPKVVSTRYYSKRKGFDTWVMIPPSEGGICFFFNDEFIPPFISTSDSLAVLEDARNREADRDDNEMQKLLIQKLPIDKTDGELLFSLPEAEELHRSVCGMLADNETIDVLTTYADVKLESVQDTDDAASASSSRLGKYTTNVYDEFGTTSAIFNPQSGSTAILYSIKKDIAIMFNWSKQYEIWINAWLRTKSKVSNLYFSIKLLPTSYLFKKDDIDTYLKLAQYGYPKQAVASAMGIDMMELNHMCDFENNILQLQNVMVPLSSSYTQSGTENSKILEKKSSSGTQKNNLGNEGGRPPLSVEERSDKTNANIESMT